MASPAKPVPQGFHTVTPHLVVRGAAEAIELYREALGAEEVRRMPAPDGKLMHAEIRIGDSMIMLNDEFPEYGSRSPQSVGGTPVTIHLYVPDVDALFERATKAGMKIAMPLMDMFWGDRYGKLEDRFGHHWSLATHKVDLTDAEIGERAKAEGM